MGQYPAPTNPPRSEGLYEAQPEVMRVLLDNGIDIPPRKIFISFLNGVIGKDVEIDRSVLAYQQIQQEIAKFIPDGFVVFESWWPNKNKTKVKWNLPIIRWLFRHNANFKDLMDVDIYEKCIPIV